MSETASDRIALAKIVRELERQLHDNMEAIFKPLIAHKDHVTVYFQGYSNYLTEALKFEQLPTRKSLLEAQASLLFIHRDNLGALAGRIGELAAVLEASTIDIETDLKNSKAEVLALRSEVRTKDDQLNELSTQVVELERSSRARDVKELQAWGIALGAIWAITFGGFRTEFAWLAGVLVAVNTSLIVLIFRRSD